MIKLKLLTIVSMTLSSARAQDRQLVQHLQFDDKGWVYMADIANPGIIALNLKTKKAKRSLLVMVPLPMPWAITTLPINWRPPQPLPVKQIVAKRPIIFINLK
jgi:hypothetical protein